MKKTEYLNRSSLPAPVVQQSGGMRLLGTRTHRDRRNPPARVQRAQFTVARNRGDW